MIYESKKNVSGEKVCIDNHTCMCLFILIISYLCIYYERVVTIHVHINIYIRNIVSCTHEENINI